jgi:type II pantothenate kinase
VSAAGVDLGATLAKVALQEDAGESPRLELLPVTALDRVEKLLSSVALDSVGLTGGGAAQLAARLATSRAGAVVNEFAAWGAGAARLLSRDGASEEERYLLVSVGTGTSVLLVDGMSVTRTGGTALGGGTVVGLGSALLGCAEFAPLCTLAEAGRRANVDLLVSDIYRVGEIPLLGELTASSFGRLARPEASGPTREDLAAAIMGLVGENVALICGGLAAAAQVRRIVFAGSTLRRNPVLCEVLRTVTERLGRHATLLADGEFAGALGALELAASRPQAGAQ